MDQLQELVAEVGDLRHRVEELEVERACRSLLARYGFYADHGRYDDWVNLFTPDGALDHYGSDPSNPDPNQPPIRFVGHDELLSLIRGATQKAIEGGSQHHMDGQPSTFRLIDDSTAEILSYAVMYVKVEGGTGTVGPRLSNSMHRWTFRRIDGQWYIAENVRRRMGNPDTAALFEGI